MSTTVLSINISGGNKMLTPEMPSLKTGLFISFEGIDPMDALFSTHSIGISDLREAPARAFEQAGDQALRFKLQAGLIRVCLPPGQQPACQGGLHPRQRSLRSLRSQRSQRALAHHPQQLGCWADSMTRIAPQMARRRPLCRTLRQPPTH